MKENKTIAEYRRLRVLRVTTPHVPMQDTRRYAKIIFLDANIASLGRVSSIVSMLLRGCEKGNFSYHNSTFNQVVLYNVSNLKLTGDKEKQKILYSHSGFRGGLKKTSFNRKDERNTCYHAWNSINGMMPKNRNRKRYMKNLSLVSNTLNVLEYNLTKAMFKGCEYYYTNRFREDNNKDKIIYSVLKNLNTYYF